MFEVSDSPLEPLETLIDRIEPEIDHVEAAVHAYFEICEVPVDGLKAPVDGLKAPVDVSKPLHHRTLQVEDGVHELTRRRFAVHNGVIACDYCRTVSFV